MSARRIRIPAPDATTEAAPAPAYYKRERGTCKRLCKGGFKCDCDAHYKHQHCICHRETCICHSRQAYDAVRGVAS